MASQITIAGIGQILLLHAFVLYRFASTMVTHSTPSPPPAFSVEALHFPALLPHRQVNPAAPTPTPRPPCPTRSQDTGGDAVARRLIVVLDSMLALGSAVLLVVALSGSVPSVCARRVFLGLSATSLTLSTILSQGILRWMHLVVDSVYGVREVTASARAMVIVQASGWAVFGFVAAGIAWLARTLVDSAQKRLSQMSFATAALIIVSHILLGT